MSKIDTSLLPHPTGRAATLAAAHNTPHPLQLYGAWFCPFVQRAWIVLAEKHIPHQYVEINPYRKERGFLELNPRGLVPTLVVGGGEDGEDGGAGGGGGAAAQAGFDIDGAADKKTRKRVLYESTVICEYLDEAYVDGGLLHRGRLMPEGVFERARCRLWIHHVATRVVPGFYRLLQHTEGKGYSIGEARGELLAGLKAFAKEMVDSGSGRDGPWFLGARFSLVDVMLAPWARRLFLIDHYKSGGVGIPKEGERGEDDEVWARWDRWFGAIVERESVKATWSEDEKYIEAYKRYADDTTSSEVGQATRQGRSLP